MLCGSSQNRPQDDREELDEITKIAVGKQWQSASVRIAEYRRKYPNSDAGAVLQAEILVHVGLLTDAEDVLQHFSALHPKSILVLSASAELSRKLGDKATAEDLLLHCTRYSPMDTGVWKRLGNFYLSVSRKEAMGSFQHALKLAPGDASALAGLAQARHEQGDDKGARRDFEQAAEWNMAAKAPDAMVSFLFAEFLLDKTEYPESLKYYKLAVDQDPSLTQARLGRAKCLLHLREWERAESDLKTTAEDEEWEIESLNLLIKVYQAEGKTTEAQQTISKEEEISSQQNREKAARNQIASWLQNAHALELQKQFQPAVQAYEQILHEHADVSAAWLELGRCYAELGELNEAESALRHFLGKQDESSVGHAVLGKVLLREKKIGDARAEFTRAQTIDPLFAEATIGIAASYIVEQRYPEAIQTLRSARSIGGVEARLMLTEALYRNGERDAALNEIDEAIRRYPSNKEAVSMRKSLLQQR